MIALSFRDRLENSDMTISASPFSHNKTKILHVRGRTTAYASGQRNQEFLEKHSTQQKVILPRKAWLTQAVVLNAHQRNLCTSASFFSVILDEQFCIPRAQMTIKTIIIKCSVCLLAGFSTKNFEPLTENIPKYPTQNKIVYGRNLSYSVFYYG